MKVTIMSDNHGSLDINAQDRHKSKRRTEFEQVNQKVFSDHKSRKEIEIIQIDNYSREHKLNHHHLQSGFPIKPLAPALKYGELVKVKRNINTPEGDVKPENFMSLENRFHT